MRLLLLGLLAAAAAAGPLTEGRRGDAKAKLLRARGGNAATEKAVQRALAWLAAHQREDGSWDADGFMETAGCDCDGKGGGWHGEEVPCPFDAEVTGLATLAFLGAGHDHRTEGPFREAVARALQWMQEGVRGRTLFAISYATQALAEAYDLSGDEALKESVERGLAVLLESRQPQGGWRYFPGAAMASGVPTTTAVVSALGTAGACGFRVDDGWREPVLAWLDRLVDRETGRVRYTLDADALGYTPTTTNAASGLLIRTWLGRPDGDAEVARGVRTVLERKPKWSIKFKRMTVNGVEREVQIGYLQHYYWWHATEALARRGGSSWSSWNGALKKALLGKQRTGGHAAGSWDPAGTYGKVGGRVYSTALCAMMLEAPYRHP